MKTAVFFVGELNDNGFNSSALAGTHRVSARLGGDDLPLTIVSDIPYDQDVICHRLRQVALANEHVVFVGGQGNLATPVVAADFPDKYFTIIQGEQIGDNICSYDVRQEDSAFLAGFLAARLSQTKVIAHLSGHRVTPGLKGRAAYIAGAKLADPSVSVLTSFCGTQDDNAITYQWAKSQFEHGADILFTMLNGARQGAIEACAECEKYQIGNALDWVAKDSNIFIASALARIDLGVEHAIDDALKRARPNRIVPLGIRQGAYASLSISNKVPHSHTEEIEELTTQIRQGKISVPSLYQGEEFILSEAS